MRVLVSLAAALLAAAQAHARTITAGPGKDFPDPAHAIYAASDGDTVLIEPGEYYQCAVVLKNRITIEGNGPGATLTDVACEGKAALVIRGEGVTIRNLTLTRIRVHDENGAGIRLEASGLLVDQVRFINDQVGILAGSVGGEVRIQDSRFEAGGVSSDRPRYAVQVGQIAKLRVERCTFTGVKGGQISTDADRTELAGNQIGDGTGENPAEAVLATRGDLVMQDNTITIGPNAPRRDTAVLAWDDARVTLQRNRLVNQTGRGLVLLRDWTSTPPVLDANQLAPGDDEVSRGGLLRHHASTFLAEKKAQSHALLSALKRFVKVYILHREA